MSPTLLPTMDELSDTPTQQSRSTTLSSLTSSKTRLSTPSSLRLETSSWLPEDETWVDQVLSFTGRDIWVVSISFTSGMSLTELSLPGKFPHLQYIMISHLCSDSPTFSSLARVPRPRSLYPRVRVSSSLSPRSETRGGGPVLRRLR